MMRIWHDGHAIVRDTLLPLPSGSLSVAMTGTDIHVMASNGLMVVALPYQEIRRQDGTGFSSCAEARAYLEGEFAKYPPEAVGPQGPRGFSGSTGAQGLKGDPGSTGATGPQGNVGSAGPKGDAGQTGATGPKGDAGAAGVPGAAGLKGDTGAAGPQGATGPAGAKGDAGATGPTGPTGAKGDVGATGPKGDTGTTGGVGPAGAKGDVGAQGPAGFSTVTPATPIRVIGTAFQPSATKATLVSYSVKTQATNPLLAGTSSASVALLSDAINPPTTERARAEATSAVGLAVAVAITTSNTAPLTYLVPAGHYVRLVSSITGTAATSIVSQVETALG